MKSLALRLTLLGLFVAAAGVATYFSWTDTMRTRQEERALAAFDASAVAAQRDVLELRAAQQAYVAAGQGDQFWASKVDTVTSRLRETLTSLRSQSTAAPAQSALDNAASALQDFEQMDRRARDYARSGQKLLASDLIFANGFELTGAAAGAVEDARTAERQLRAENAGALQKRSLAAAGGLVAFGILVIAALVPRGADEQIVPDVAPRITPRVDAPRQSPRPEASLALDEGWSPAKVVPKGKQIARPAAQTATAQAAKPAHQATAKTGPGRLADASTADKAVAPVAVPPVAVAAVAPAPPPVVAPAIDLPGVASLCSDLARVMDTQALPAILERAAAVLDAPGIVLWIADPDGRELSPIITHGYSKQIVARLGTILRDAENATASAFRTSLLQTVKTDAASNGAVAAPLVTPSGCVGVMAAEVRNAGEADAAKLAVATIVAAQLATLVGPPSVRATARAEAAGV
jgi:hypothetical protein